MATPTTLAAPSRTGAKRSKPRPHAEASRRQAVCQQYRCEQLLAPALDTPWSDGPDLNDMPESWEQQS